MARSRGLGTAWKEALRHVEPHSVEDLAVSRRGLVLFVAMCVIWGIPYLLIKVKGGGLEGWDRSTSSSSGSRSAPSCWSRSPSSRVEIRPLLGRWGWIVAYTIIEMGIPWVLLSDAELRISSSLSGLLVSTVPSSAW